jgi:hypothetical protein
VSERAKLCLVSVLPSNRWPYALRALTLSAAAVGLIALGAIGCDRHRAATRSVTPVYDKATGRLTRLDYDPDGNGRVNVRTEMNGRHPVRSFIDQNEDGTVERWEYYDASGRVGKVGQASRQDGREDTWLHQGADGAVVRIERATRGDGRVTRTEEYARGTVTEAREDSNGDGRLDRWETYRDGVLVVLALDTSRERGRPDRRLIYRPNGTLERLEEDATGNGVFTPVATSLDKLGTP